MSWTPQDWKSKHIVQDVVYENQEHVERVLNKLNRLPPMVSTVEVRSKSPVFFKIRARPVLCENYSIHQEG